MKPTFPIDEQELKSKGIKTIFGSILTWVACLPAFGAWSILEASPLIYLPLAGVTVGGLWYYWKQEITKKRPTWIEEKVRASNTEQNEMLKHQIKRYETQGARWEQKQLQQALRSKEKIETYLLTKQPNIEIWARIESLIDTLSFSLIEKLDHYRKTEDDQVKKDVQEAVYQLQQTEINLADIIAPHLGVEDNFLPQEDKLNTALRELKEEREIAQRVKERIQSGYSQTTYSSETGISE